MGPGFEANAPRTEVAESSFCLQLQFDYQASGPLVQQNSLTITVLDVTHSFDVVFSSDRSVYQFSADLGVPDVTGSDAVLYSWSDRFTGKPYSQTTGLYYEFQRWYDPSTGRFISADPFRGHRLRPQSLNPYTYVQDTPTSASDPTGLDGGFGAEHRWEQQCQQDASKCTVNGAQSLRVARDALIFAGVVTAGVVVCILICLEAAGALGLICTVDEPGCVGVADTLSKDVLDLGGKDAIDVGSKDSIDLLTKSGGDALVKGTTDDLVNTSTFWNTIESSSSWSRATFDTPLDSLTWHLAKHALGLSADEYTQDAGNLRDALWDQGKLWPLRGGAGMGWKIESDFGAGQGGIYTLERLIVTFWYGPPEL